MSKDIRISIIPDVSPISKSQIDKLPISPDEIHRGYITYRTFPAKALSQLRSEIEEAIGNYEAIVTLECDMEICKDELEAMCNLSNHVTLSNQNNLQC